VFITALLMAQPVELKGPINQIEARSLNETGWTIPPGWYGFVEAAGSGIVRRAGIDYEAGMAALERLGSPESESRSPDYEGRRLVRVDGGYLVLNFFKYRDRDYTGAERARRYRERQAEKRAASHRDITPSHRDITQAEAEAEAEEYSEKQLRTPAASLGVRSRKGSEGSGREEAAVEGLDPDSWQRWLDYRKQIGKAIKPASMLAAKRKLAAFGQQQSAAVEQSIANGWQGLFDVRVNGSAGPRRTRYEESQARLAAWKPNATVGNPNTFLVEVKP
jgi:hypothetical protein